jgi:hypothetical protein
MSMSQMPIVLVAIASWTVEPCFAQTMPSTSEFDAKLKQCATAQNIGLDPKLFDKISTLYSGENSRQIFKSPSEFYAILPEGSRIDAYLLYTQCIKTILPESATSFTSNQDQVPPATQTPTFTTYLVCTGEYERACLNHQVYLYCGADVTSWAKERCSSFSITVLNTYGGNKCGYSLQQVNCTNPR